MTHRANRVRPTTVGAAVAALILAICLAGCGGDSDDDPDAQPSLATSDSTTTTSPTPTPSAWESDYNPKQMAALDKAVSTVKDYEDAIWPYYVKGKVTDDAKQIMAKYWFNSGATPLAELQSYEDSGITYLPTREKLLWSRPTTIDVVDGGARVEMSQCIDFRPVTAVQYGKKIKTRVKTPVLRQVVVAQVDGRWLISSIISSAASKTPKKCSA